VADNNSSGNYITEKIKEKTDYRASPIQILGIKAINLTPKQECKTFTVYT
jgi:hypothetical protein